MKGVPSNINITYPILEIITPKVNNLLKLNFTFNDLTKAQTFKYSSNITSTEYFFKIRRVRSNLNKVNIQN